MVGGGVYSTRLRGSIFQDKTEALGKPRTGWLRLREAARSTTGAGSAGHGDIILNGPRSSMLGVRCWCRESRTQ